MIMGGGGLGLIPAPATEAIMGAVSVEKAGVGSAVNDATRLFGAALGVAVIGSIASSLYRSQLGADLPPGLPQDAIEAARSSVGGALVAAQSLPQADSGLANSLSAAATGAFVHSLHGSLRVAGSVALAGAVLAAALPPSRPRGRGTPTPVKDPAPRRATSSRSWATTPPHLAALSPQRTTASPSSDKVKARV